MKHKNATESIEDTAEAWESGQLGEDSKFVRRVTQERHKEVDDILGLQSISIRLPKDLIEQFKLIAKIHGLGYQPLMRDALKRFAESETKIILSQIAEKKTRQKEGSDESNCEPYVERRKAA